MITANGAAVSELDDVLAPQSPANTVEYLREALRVLCEVQDPSWGTSFVHPSNDTGGQRRAHLHAGGANDSTTSYIPGSNFEIVSASSR
jgi:hypothetical protein